MKIAFAGFLFLALSQTAAAQPAPSIDCQQAINALRNQRELASDQAFTATAQVSQLQIDITKLREQIRDLQTQLAAAKAASPTLRPTVPPAPVHPPAPKR